MCVDVVAKMNSAISVPRNGSIVGVIGSLKNPSWNVRRKEALLLFLSKSAAMSVGSITVPEITATTVETCCSNSSTDARDVCFITADGALTTEDSHSREREEVKKGFLCLQGAALLFPSALSSLALLLTSAFLRRVIL